MKGMPQERAVELAQYIIENNATVRSGGKFGVSKSTVHKDVTSRLCMSTACWRLGKAGTGTKQGQRHIRGGLATRENTRGG